jgi:hypothetical protein
MVGYEANEVVGMDFRQFIAPEDIDRVVDRLPAKTSRGKCWQ